jgi:CheY-like chemotaxis protein
LIVEDDFDIRDTLSQILEEEGYEVVGTANGREAMEWLTQHPAPRLILLDLMMPVMNGWQFRAEQSQRPELACIPVIIISADASVQEKAAKLDTAGFLRKPIQLDQLLDTIKQLVA